MLNISNIYYHQHKTGILIIMDIITKIIGGDVDDKVAAVIMEKLPAL